jgi:hypothetical protein
MTRVVLRTLVAIYGAAHFYRDAPSAYLASMGQDIGLVRMLEVRYPGRTLAVIPAGGVRDALPPGVGSIPDPHFEKFDRALRTPVRPVLVPLDRTPFRDFTAEEFLGRDLLACGGSGGCRSVFQGSTLTLGQMADACVYFGKGGNDAKARR